MLKNDLLLKGCGGMSDVCVHAPAAHMHTYGTAKETEQMLIYTLKLRAPKILHIADLVF